MNPSELSNEKLVETNRRLNRRCQELEKEIARRDRADRHVMQDFKSNAQRVYYYANMLRDELHKADESLNAWYRSVWERLPKPPGAFDGIDIRVKYTLELLSSYPNPADYEKVLEKEYNEEFPNDFQS